MARKNVFVVGLNDFNHQMLRNLRGAAELEFHQLLEPALFYDTEEFDIPGMIEQAIAQLEAFDGSIDAIAGYMDFPVSTMLPLLCERFGTASVSLEALLKCEHKYWSRLCQREVIAEHIPGFAAFDPFDDDALQKIGLPFPFFVKPIKSSGSRLGFRIEGPEDFDHAIEQFRASIGTISEPFDFSSWENSTCRKRSPPSAAGIAWPRRSSAGASVRWRVTLSRVRSPAPGSSTPFATRR